jgi:protein phosphatase
MVVHDSSPEPRRGWLTGDAAGTLLVVADGMGGMGGGGIASRVAVQTITSYLLNAMPWFTPPKVKEASIGREPLSSVPSVRDQLCSALVASDSTVRSTGASVGEPRMGTTLTMALVLWPVLYVAHVGDSRCYLFRSGQLTRLTTDHTLAQQIVDQGAGSLGPDSGLHHVLWNCLGGSEEIAKPQTMKLRLDPADILLLCSDGLTKHMTDDEIAAAVATAEPSAALCAKLVDGANAGGGSDNVTVVIARSTL